MGETLFPQSPNWTSKILTSSCDGSVAYGSKNNIVILKRDHCSIKPIVITEAHNDKITSVIFSPSTSSEKLHNTILSCSDDGYVKLWNVSTLTNTIGHKSHGAPGCKASGVVKVVNADWSHYNHQYAVSAAENDTLVLWDIIANVTTNYLFPKLKPAVIECSFHNEKIVGVGSKSGLVYIIKLTEKGEIIHKLRGHDKEVQGLAWCPNSFDLDKGYSDEFLLASSSVEKYIYVWRTVSGLCETKIPIPKAPLSKEETRSRVKADINANFTSPLLWFEPDKLYLGSLFGELMFCEMKLFLNASTENRNVSDNQIVKGLSFWNLCHSFHSNSILVMSAVHGLKNISDDNYTNQEFRESALIWTLGKDRKIVAVDPNSKDKIPIFDFHTINGNAFDAAVSPHDPNKVAMALGDGKLRIWNASKSSGHTQAYWQTGNDRIYSVAWHPSKEGLLAYGSSLGRVGVIDIYSTKQPSYFKLCHSHTVYRLTWGPSLATNTSEKKDFCLYSVGGNYVMLHNPNYMDTGSVQLQNIINLPYKKITDISWKPDYTLLAIGFNNGTVSLLKVPELKIIHNIQPYKKNIQSLNWHPVTTTLDSDVSAKQGYFTMGSFDTTNPVLNIYNCFLEDGSYNLEQICTLKGHSGYIQYVAWSPHICGRLVSTSSDYTVRVWDVTLQTQLACFYPIESKLSFFCIWSPVDPDILLAGFADRFAMSWKISSSSKEFPLIVMKNHKGDKVKTMVMSDCMSPVVNSHVDVFEEGKYIKKTEEDILPNIAFENEFMLAKTNVAHKKTKENKKIFANAWKQVKDPFQNCYQLLKCSSQDSKNEKFILPFFNEEDNLLNYIKFEEETLQGANALEEFHQLSLWRGNIKDVIEEKIKTGHLNDFLVSIAPLVSPRLWQEACISYSKSLSEMKLYKKAACYLIAVHKVYDAINLLNDADLYLEALCIARSCLPESDPILQNVVRNYGNWLIETDSSYLKACECFIYVEDYFEVAKILGQKKQAEYLSLAAIASNKAGCEDMELEYANNALLACLETVNWELSSRICNDHIKFKHLSFLNTVNQLLHKLEDGELILEEDLISHIGKIVGTDEDNSMYLALNYSYDKSSIYCNINKLYATLTRELCLAWFAPGKEILLVHIIRAMNTASKFIKSTDDSPLHKLCFWLSPNGYFNENSIFCLADENISFRLISVRAFLCQSIVEYLDSILNKDDDISVAIEKFEPVLIKLLCDVLDKDAFNYFKNQISVTSLEKKITDAYVKKNKMFNCGIIGNGDQEVLQDAFNGGELHTDSMESEKASSDENEHSIFIGEKHEENKIEISEVTSDMDKLNQLKTEIINFENSRIAAPNPVYVAHKLRRVAEAFKGVKGESCLLELSEQAWKKLEIDY